MDTGFWGWMGVMMNKWVLIPILLSGVVVYQNCVPYEGFDGAVFQSTLNGTADFAQVKSILDGKCLTCHSTPNSGNRNVDLTSYQAILDSDIMIPGNSANSALYLEVSSGSMPQGLPALSLQETEIIRSWIDAGAPGEDGNVANYPPVITMPADMTVQLPQGNVEVLARVTDPDGAVLRTVWSQVAGPNTATFTNARTPALLVSNLVAGNYTFQLLAEDDFGAITTGRVNLRANASTTPPPPPPNPTVSFASDVNPILQANCVSCHGGANPSGGFSVESHAGVVSRVVVGSPSESLLYTRVLNDSMPAGGNTPLSAAQKTIIQTWIQEDATNN